MLSHATRRATHREPCDPQGDSSRDVHLSPPQSLDQQLAEKREVQQLQWMCADLELELEQVRARVARYAAGAERVGPTTAKPCATTRDANPHMHVGLAAIQCKLQYEDSTNRRTAQVYKLKCVWAATYTVAPATRGHGRTPNHHVRFTSVHSSEQVRLVRGDRQQDG